MYAGLCPSAIWRSADGGSTWKRLDVGFAEQCGVILYPRVTCILPDLIDPDTIWAGVEIDGIYQSSDRGDKWRRLGEGLSSQDVHSMTIVPANPKKILAATNNDLNVSLDNGETWQPCGVERIFDWRYCRGIVSKADDPSILFQGNGNGPPGSEGAIRISRDGGATWNRAELTPAPNSTIWTFAVTAANPDLIAAASVSGYLYLSDDGGQSWRKLKREFGEIRSLALSA